MRRIRCILILIIVLTVLPQVCYSQDGTGLPFMKIGLGARQSGMADVFTGVGDDIYTLYWNPGGLGHIRRWQWTVSYNKWFADIYQAQAALVKQFRFFGNRKTTLGVGCNYLGMPSWDATDGLRPKVTASHLVATAAIGQRLDWISRALAIGVSGKFIVSQFGDYSAEGYAGDAGILIKPGRFALGKMGLGLFDFGIFTCGASLLHYGPGLTFDKEVTLLPLTWRAGMSLEFGSHRRWNLLLASDVVQVQNRDLMVGVGSEIWWKNVLGARIGYKFNGEDLGDLSFGFGFRWDDVFNSLLGLPSRFGDAFEISFADVNYGEALQETYRGAVTHFPVAPEPFLMEEPRVVSSMVRGESSVATMVWEQAWDPDPYDEVNYYVLVDKDSLQVEKSIRLLTRDMVEFLSSPLKDSLLLCESVSTTSHVFSATEGGVYYWAVAAYDLDYHARLAKRGTKRVSRVSNFVIATHDLMVDNFKFIPESWITTTPEQGVLSFRVSNVGTKPSGFFQFHVEDQFIETGHRDTILAVILSHSNRGLNAGEDTTYYIPWTTSHNGIHAIQAKVITYSSQLELQKKNNFLRKKVVSIPKGEFIVPDSVRVMATGYDYTDIPVVPEIYFETNSSQVLPLYYENTIPAPVLLVFADRLQRNRDVTLDIMGTIDLLSGEKDPALADERVKNVKDLLKHLGVAASQLNIVSNHSEKILGQRSMPVDSMDAIWIMQQNRKVSFHVSQENEARIFSPLSVAVDTTLREGVKMMVSVTSPGEISEWHIGEEGGLVELSDSLLAKHVKLTGTLEWDGTDRKGVLVPRDRRYLFSLFITDTLNRTFRTHPMSMYLMEKQTIRRREVFGSAKFAEVEPVYQFYWDRLMNLARELAEDPDLRIRFEGHACSIGPEYVNDRLSQRRAERFTQAFRDRVKTAYPTQYQSIWNRIEASIGFGERLPLWLKVRGRENKLLGDNNSPVGRFLNRRIMVLLYKEN